MHLRVLLPPQTDWTPQQGSSLPAGPCRRLLCLARELPHHQAPTPGLMMPCAHQPSYLFITSACPSPMWLSHEGDTNCLSYHHSKASLKTRQTCHSAAHKYQTSQPMLYTQWINPISILPSKKKLNSAQLSCIKCLSGIETQQVMENWRARLSASGSSCGRRQCLRYQQTVLPVSGHTFVQGCSQILCNILYPCKMGKWCAGGRLNHGVGIQPGFTKIKIQT